MTLSAKSGPWRDSRNSMPFSFPPSGARVFFFLFTTGSASLHLWLQALCLPTTSGALRRTL
ncbi:MAG: hypothetical protein AABZ47_15640, partial [Planctomycetota bacterium]